MCANVLIVTVVMQHMDEAFVNCKYFFFYFITHVHLGWDLQKAWWLCPLPPKFANQMLYTIWLIRNGQNSSNLWSHHKPNSSGPPTRDPPCARFGPERSLLIALLYFTHPNDKISIFACYYLWLFQLSSGC
jgi:hypothetical protein